MFAVGVDEMSWDDLDEANYDWPPVEAVWEYRRKVRTVVDRVIREAPLSLPIGWDDPFWAVMMGIEHERIHLETSSVLIRQHSLSLVRPGPTGSPAGCPAKRRRTSCCGSPPAASRSAADATNRYMAGTTSTAVTRRRSPNSHAAPTSPATTVPRFRRIGRLRRR